MNLVEDFLSNEIKNYVQHPPANFHLQDLPDADEISARLYCKKLACFVKDNFK